jgi:uncharacterized protein (TIGR02145 family)
MRLISTTLFLFAGLACSMLVRAVSSNAVIIGKSPGDSSELVYDIDCNEYSTVTIGGQIWLKENLKTTRYRNGDPIETTAPFNVNIQNQSEPKYQWAYAGKEEYVETYGRLYTWHAATDQRGITPEGWRVPTEQDFLILANYLIENGDLYSFDGIKNSGTTATNQLAKALSSSTGWSTSTVAGSPGNNPNKNNTTGFDAVPGGKRNSDGAMVFGPELTSGNLSSFWTSSEISQTHGNGRWYFHNSLTFSSRGAGEDKKVGMSIRCVRDVPSTNTETIASDLDVLHIYPTSVRSDLTIRFSSSEKRNIDIEILSIQGKAVSTSNFITQEGINIFSLDVSHLINGVYLIRLGSQQTIRTAKFAKL